MTEQDERSVKRERLLRNAIDAAAEAIFEASPVR